MRPHPECPMPHLGTCIVIVREDGKVLMGRRTGSHAAGTWSFPGGHVDVGETLELAAHREVVEETGIVLTGFLHNVFTSADTIDGHPYVTLYFLAQLHSPQEAQVVEPDKCAEWQWFLWDELPEPLMGGIPKFLHAVGLLKSTLHPSSHAFAR